MAYGESNVYVTPKGQTRDPNTLCLERNISKTAGNAISNNRYY